MALTRCQSAVPLLPHAAFMGLLPHLGAGFLSDGSRVDFPATLDMTG